MPSLPTNPASTLSMQAVMEGNFRREQKTDDQLKHCQVLQVGAENLYPNQGLPVAFLVGRGLLYYHCSCRGEPCDDLILPMTKIDSIMHLSHPHPLGDYLEPQNTLEKIQD